jgi:exosortase
MNEIASIQPGAMSEKSRNPALGAREWVMPLFILAAGWVMAFNVLRTDWGTNAQYYYGWFVPLLALGLFRLRWISRPAPAAPAKTSLTIFGSIAALCFLLPMRLIEEANPEWRLIQWAHALQMTFLTLCMLYYAAGWPWVRHFAFPVCFVLVGVPWPVPLEQDFVQNLMNIVAGMTVELVGLFNIPAVQHGNVIKISAGLVGIDEACSGVRSLQTALFICLFLGELHRFSWRRRVALVLLGFAMAMATNLGRTFYLVWSAFHSGMDRMHVVHDSAGQFQMIFTLLGIWAISQLLRSKATRAATLQQPYTGSASLLRSIPTRFAFAALVWLAAAEVATQAWYRAHESKAVPNERWTVSWPAPAQIVKIDDIVTAILRYNDGRQAIWQDDAGNKWQAFFFRWAPGRNSARLASAHTPDICMRGVGCKLTSDLGIQVISAHGLNLPFHQYLFQRAGEPVHVFYCRWQDQVSPQSDSTGYDIGRWSRFRAVVEGRRHLGQQALEAIISGPDTPADGLSAFKSQISQLIRR